MAQAMRREYSARILGRVSQFPLTLYCWPRPSSLSGLEDRVLVEYSSAVLRLGSQTRLEWAEAGVMVLFLFGVIHGYGVGED